MTVPRSRTVFGRLQVSLGLLALAANAAPLAGRQVSNDSTRILVTADVPANTITGVVVNARTQLPLPRVNVAITETRRTVLSDTTGRFTLSVPGPGTYHLSVEALGYRPVLEEFELPVGLGMQIAIALTEYRIPLCGLVVCGGELPCGDVRVEVRDALTGRAPEGVTTLYLRVGSLVDSMSASAPPGADKLDLGAGAGLTPKSPYELEIKAPGYEPWQGTGPPRDECGIYRESLVRVRLVPKRSGSH